MSTPTASPVDSSVDMMNQLAGLAPDAPLAVVRAVRPDVVRHSQGSYDHLLAAPSTPGLSLVERTLVALRVAVLTHSAPLLAHYQHRLTALGASVATIAAIVEQPLPTTLDQRTDAIMRHVDLLTQAPGQATPGDLQKLQASGLSDPEIVTLAQLIAFLSFQVRVLPVLSLLAKGDAV